MQDQVIGDNVVQEAIARYLAEARICARTTYTPAGMGVLGISAMLAVLTCMNAVGEAVAKSKHPDPKARDAFREFLESMEDKTSWVVAPNGKRPRDSDIIDRLVNMRHDLVHALSLPLNVELIPDSQTSKLRGYWVIAVVEFIDAVEKTVAKITREQPALKWPKTSTRRGFVATVPARREDLFSYEFTTYDTLGIEPTSAGSIAMFFERNDLP